MNRYCPKIVGTEVELLDRNSLVESAPLPSVAYQGAVLFGYPTEGRG